MFKDFILKDTELAIKQAVEAKELGQMDSTDGINLVVEKPKNPDFGDFAVNVSSLARNARIAPPMIANAIVKYLPTTDYTTSVIGGFINFKLSDKVLANVIKEILEKKENFGKPEHIEKEKIILEYVSANPTGPFHIGHGRWAAMGSALANLLKFYGHDVYQEFYINDAGSQIQKLGRSLNIRVKQELGENVDFPEDEEERKNYYAGEYLIPVAKQFLKEHEPTDDINILSDYAKQYMEKVPNFDLILEKDKTLSFYRECFQQVVGIRSSTMDWGLDANPEEGRLNEEQEIEQISTYLNFYRTNVCFLPKVIPEDIVYDEEYLRKICGAQLFPNLADARDSKEKLFRIANALRLPIGGIEQLLITQFIIKKGEDYQKISELLHMIAEQH